ncbi:protein of unknown function [Cupriavidus taiwanensis]|uniref:Uncharacterized protein n=1 Tax=Cupriavidus taiwanensis TaxID=164546 RepID=A0A7Z7NM46_9BURK|nr:protein of unknown function [Cupriavidus taiwanensis]SOZ03272.1 hypothetical protein CBM2597_A120002 [Cupriavidus taiwanensis]SOZ06552.1 hypothetical protein CBM2595_A81237 [Cupriavidus taiwanensis]SPC20069.1 hypothetical protein CBM2594_A90002 [Cupriavidus taiwanensis]SPD41667.1 protein of unknown function [Cupriavidus taiwanensis]
MLSSKDAFSTSESTESKFASTAGDMFAQDFFNTTINPRISTTMMKE